MGSGINKNNSITSDNKITDLHQKICDTVIKIVKKTSYNTLLNDDFEMRLSDWLLFNPRKKFKNFIKDYKKEYK